MGMRLVDNWRRVLRHAWSLRLSLLAAVLSGIEVVLPFFSDLFPRGIFAGLSFVVVSLASVARVVAQPRMHQ